MKKFWITLLACLTFVCMALGVACASGPKLAFNEGYMEEVKLGEPIMLDEYVDPRLTDDYTLILTHDETGEQRDLKMLGQWTTEMPGTYTLTYTVNSGEYKGTVSTKISVVVPDARWQYSTPTLVYRAGDTMEFNVLKRNLNIVVKSYYSYRFFVKSVQIDGVKTDLTGETSYTFEKEGEHVVTFAVETEDGQVLSADQKITVRPQQVLAEGAQEWMDANGITAYDYTLVSPDGKVSLDAGYYSSFIKDNVPYLAFNGVEGSNGYGANTYMMVDFTGKNLPQVAFFCDEVTSSFTDGKNGILFSNGTSLNDGRFWSALDASRLTVFGPKKAQYAEFDNKGRMLSLGSVADPCPLSYNALSDTDSYRYIIGIEEPKTNSVTARILLINMTTGERVFDYKQKLTGYSSPSGNTALNLVDYFKGSIVLYGRYGIKLEFDKVHLPITGISNIYDLDVAAEFKDSYKEQYNLNTIANVSDYIDVPDTDYEFTVTDPEGMPVDIDADGNFQYTKSGKYLLRFDPKQDGVRASSISVRVLYDVNKPMPADFLEQEGALAAFSDSGLKTNTKTDFVNEGVQSIEYYAINGKNDGTLTLYLNKSFMEYIFLSREVNGIKFDVYSPKAVSYSLFDHNLTDNVSILQDYTGTIPAETWTTMTITREMCMKNSDVYKSQGYSIAINLTGEEKFFARECVYIDNVQLLALDLTPTLESSVQAFMEANNITAYAYKEINADMSATLYEGTYQKEWWNVANDDMPYIAYNGNYGAGSYVVVDFTGKNVPQMALFVDKVTSSLVDGGEGLYIHTGGIKKSGEIISDTDGGRLTFLGPNKMIACRPDAEGRVGKQFGTKAWQPDGTKDEAGTTVSPLSIRGLQDGVHYRYVIGIKTACEEGTTKGRIVLDLLLLNLDTNEEVVRYEWSEATEGLKSLIDGGSIVMYSRYNTPITLDKIYAVYTGVTDVYAIDKVTEVLGA